MTTAFPQSAFAQNPFSNTGTSTHKSFTAGQTTSSQFWTQQKPTATAWSPSAKSVFAPSNSLQAPGSFVTGATAPSQLPNPFPSMMPPATHSSILGQSPFQQGASFHPMPKTQTPVQPTPPPFAFPGAVHKQMPSVSLQHQQQQQWAPPPVGSMVQFPPVPSFNVSLNQIPTIPVPAPTQQQQQQQQPAVPTQPSMHSMSAQVTPPTQPGTWQFPPFVPSQQTSGSLSQVQQPSQPAQPSMSFPSTQFVPMPTPTTAPTTVSTDVSRMTMTNFPAVTTIVQPPQQVTSPVQHQEPAVVSAITQIEPVDRYPRLPEVIEYEPLVSRSLVHSYTPSRVVSMSPRTPKGLFRNTHSSLPISCPLSEIQMDFVPRANLRRLTIDPDVQVITPLRSSPPQHAITLSSVAKRAVSFCTGSPASTVCAANVTNPVESEWESSPIIRPVLYEAVANQHLSFGGDVCNPHAPKLHAKGYETVPSMESLRRMTKEQLQQVHNFTITRKGYGSIYWPGLTDVTDLDLDVVVKIERRSITVYPSAEGKPREGEKLNKPAVVTLEQCYKTEKQSGERIDNNEEGWARYGKYVTKATREFGGQLVCYNGETGVWKFQVPHF